MSGNTSYILRIIIAVIALYAVSTVFYAIYRTFKGHFDHDICYGIRVAKGQACEYRHRVTLDAERRRLHWTTSNKEEIINESK